MRLDSPVMAISTEVLCSDKENAKINTCQGNKNISRFAEKLWDKLVNNSCLLDSIHRLAAYDYKDEKVAFKTGKYETHGVL